ncbi:hypothetical protein KUV50_04795 [Membranicola marinus]|uniref:Uncharacterized protein n=1 Tax=Membranihabitans marinus TaxID=1227546 RepID=A0A953HKP4_9BACT|nr:hypothetical protein [Membranihabitans marinus]MBY5957442.1 hypothetical protein [Membranihabitans marinus]
MYASKYNPGKKPELLFYGREKQTIPNLKKLQEEGASISILHTNTEVTDISSKLKTSGSKTTIQFFLPRRGFQFYRKIPVQRKIETSKGIYGTELEGPMMVFTEYPV